MHLFFDQFADKNFLTKTYSLYACITNLFEYLFNHINQSFLLNWIFYKLVKNYYCVSLHNDHTLGQNPKWFYIKIPTSNYYKKVANLCWIPVLVTWLHYVILHCSSAVGIYCMTYWIVIGQFKEHLTYYPIWSFCISLQKMWSPSSVSHSSWFIFICILNSNLGLISRI